ncbi:hypothetical protein FG386_001691 [Cryptosporidium ryanae]|uniref:uncharacterized protein n=1 Tax=Cryptosporidium ryanae TaxID=515981 RepID=UPI00351A6A0D|nr:hypothetical protein FG386_001691 [Cryptosporidium ryanae]
MNKGKEFHKEIDLNCKSGISSVILTDNYVFAGLIGEESNVNVYNYKETNENIKDYEYYTPDYILENNHGGISKLVISPCKNLLLGVTCYGWIYIWDISVLSHLGDKDNKMNDYSKVESIKPKLSFVNNHPGDSICVDFINSNIIVTAGINPGYSISFISVKTGKKIASYLSRKNEISGLAWPFYFKTNEKDPKDIKNVGDPNASVNDNATDSNNNLELAIYFFTNIAIERSSTSGGCWIALGSTNGFITVIYLSCVIINKMEKYIEERDSANKDSNKNNDSEDELHLKSSDILWKCQQISELSTDIHSLSWRPRNNSFSNNNTTASNSNSICLVCGTCDSLLRYCFIETEDREIIIKKINLVKITDGMSNSSEINSISFPQNPCSNSSPMIAVAFNKLSSSKRHPIFVSSDSNNKKIQSFSSFNVYVQDTIHVTNDSNNNNGVTTQTYFYCIGIHQDIVTCVYISPCCNYIASSSLDGHLHIYTR